MGHIHNINTKGTLVFFLIQIIGLSPLIIILLAYIFQNIFSILLLLALILF